MPRAQPPTHRPVWMVVLAATMLLYGGLTLVGGLLTVRDPRTVARHAVPNTPRTPVADEVVRKLEPILGSIVERHLTALRIDAVASIGFGLFMLYAVAAVLSRDRNGRRLVLLTAALGIAYQLGELPLRVHIAKETIAAAGPLLGEIIAVGGEASRRSQTELIATIDAATASALLVAALGVGWCVLLLRYFGGRHGRELYGLRRS